MFLEASDSAIKGGSVAETFLFGWLPLILSPLFVKRYFVFNASSFCFNYAK